MHLLSKRAPVAHPKRRRSETRLGVTQEAAAIAHPLSLAPLQIAWQSNLPRVPSVALIGLLAWVVFQLLTADRFFVFQVVVTGNARVPAAYLSKVSGVEGLNIFFLNRGDTEQRLESLPNIKHATVHAQLPDKVKIDVEEREPAFVWQTGKTTYWLDAEGVVLEPVGPSPKTITFIDADGQVNEAGAVVGQEVIDAAAVLRKWLPGKKVFQWSRTHGLSFMHDDGYPIYLGPPDDLENKLMTLQALTRELKNKNVKLKFIDLRFSGRPYYR